jgi:hypothetical protein
LRDENFASKVIRVTRDFTLAPASDERESALASGTVEGFEWKYTVVRVVFIFVAFSI